MDGGRGRCRGHKDWRRIAKKERRRRIRREAAREREAEEARLRAALERSAEYLNWRKDQEEQRRACEAREEKERAERERSWLEEEVRAQREWQVLQEQRMKARQEELEKEEKARREMEEKQEAIRKRKEEEKRKREEDMKRREEILKQIDDYIDNGIKTPEALREVIDSQPGKELCPFFSKTGACRYGDICSRNHRRVCLSRVILVPGFYSHFSLEKNSAEYDTDVGLEFESSETRQHFREFYKDVVPELESFGRIKTLKYCCNTEIHLRGNLYVEYYSERDAARALRKLKGRWYAGKQLNCEFANLKSWRSAVCGMARCPKGRACNFLHTFKNPHDEYDIKSPPRWAKQSSNHQDGTTGKRSDYRGKSQWDESTFEDTEERRNWRWSESPEVESEQRGKSLDKHRQRERSTRGRKSEESETTSDRKSGTSANSAEHRRSRSKKGAKQNSKEERARGKTPRTRASERDYEDSKASSQASGDREEASARSKDRKHSERRSRLKWHGHEHRKRRSRSTEVGGSKADREALLRRNSERPDKANSDSTGGIEGEEDTAKWARLRAQGRTPAEKLEDGWATTESESEDENKEGRCAPLDK
ncbi:hypothetical protein KM043_010531 [Ampulex compressa]|nr:hypothetical protein KM043_010531 [Ampulex compressa]